MSGVEQPVNHQLLDSSQMTENISILTQANGVGSATLDNFKTAGFDTLEEIGKLEPTELAERVDGVGFTTAVNVLTVLDKNGYRESGVTQKNLATLIDLLESLFEFDNTDRDFGVYKLMNKKRDEVNSFINNELVNYIQSEVEEMGENITDDTLDEKRADVIDALGEDALNPDGSIKERYVDVPIAQEYIRERERASATQDTDDIVADIYDQVYNFFNRYYDDGDFITQRYRTSNEPPYSVPYDGSNTHFHWVTKNQYYAKTSEQFTRFSFTHFGRTIQFVTKTGELDGSGVGNSEYFVMDAESIEIESNTETIRIAFTRRQIDDSDLERCGMTSNTRNKQQAMNEVFASELSERLGENDLPRDQDTLIDKLNEYTARNQSDFFIHKHLERFLTSELEEYIKSEVLGLGLESGWNTDSKITTEKARVVENVATKIISFLVQIEEFKRTVFEKQKFVTDSYELVPVSEISEAHYEAILSNDEQLAQWKDSYNVDTSTFSSTDLHTAPYNRMLVDTSLFEQSLTTEQPDNLLVKGENYQTLSFLKETYEGSVKCIYVDPPYNTGNANFAYNDKYQRPTWLSMLYDRLKIARELLRDNGVVFVSIDHNEIERLKILLDDIYGEENHLGTFVWKRRINDPRTDTGISTDHEYVVVYGKTENAYILGEERDFEGYSNPDNDPRGDWLSRTLKNQKDKHERPNLHYTIEDPDTGNEFTATWRSGKDSMQELIEDNRIKWPDSEDGVPRQKIFQSEMDARKPVSSWIEDTASDVDPDEVADLYSRVVLETMRNEEGTKALNNIFGYKSYDFPKPPTLIKQLILWTVEEDDIVLDFFAGSGTTAQAVMELNQQRDESIRYILVELLSQAYDVTEERIRRLAYTYGWKDGEPQVENETTLDEFSDGEKETPIAVQCLQLESYEQALDAVEFTDEQSTLAQHTDYLLNYMLDMETASSPTLFDADQLTQPTEYELNLDSQGNVTADVMTTFNYLLGLKNVTKQHTIIGEVDYTLYDGGVDEDQVRVVWRHDADEVDYDEERDALDTADYDRLYINGDSALPNATPIKQAFERQMFDTSTGDD